jgi:hypothetical protein
MVPKNSAFSLFPARRWCVGIKNPELCGHRKPCKAAVTGAALYDHTAKLEWAMADEFDKQLENIQTTVAEIVEAVRKLRDHRTAADEAAAGGEINQRLRRFLERKKQA